MLWFASRELDNIFECILYNCRIVDHSGNVPISNLSTAHRTEFSPRHPYILKRKNQYLCWFSTLLKKSISIIVFLLGFWLVKVFLSASEWTRALHPAIAFHSPLSHVTLSLRQTRLQPQHVECREQYFSQLCKASDSSNIMSWGKSNFLILLLLVSLHIIPLPRCRNSLWNTV